ncbi:hypothetical protein [Kingella oralis]|jgi:hypothetical protein|uniref:hypothetical protein n=1 Tax=Kingella oralis TaxID=505 RepID=UPI002063BE8C|nr:MAG TPA: hypothetical protein [Caudoviricetes sp.]
MPSETCINCQHADFRAAADYWGWKSASVVCKKGEAWRFIPCRRECSNGRFQAASDDVIAKRRDYVEVLLGWD